MRLQKQLLGVCKDGDVRDELHSAGVYDECYEASHWSTMSFTPWPAIAHEFQHENVRRTIQEYFK